MMETPMPKVSGFNQIPSKEPVLYTVAEAAKRMRVDPIDIADMILNRALECVTSGKTMHIPVTAVTELIEKRCAMESVLRTLIDMAVRTGVLDVNLTKTITWLCSSRESARDDPIVLAR
jgi:hypothetical protein